MCGIQIHTSSATSAIITVNELASRNANLQPPFIAGVATLTARVTAERKTRSSRACTGAMCSKKLAVIGVFPFLFRSPWAFLQWVNSSAVSRCLPRRRWRRSEECPTGSISGWIRGREHSSRAISGRGHAYSTAQDGKRSRPIAATQLTQLMKALGAFLYVRCVMLSSNVWVGAYGFDWEGSATL